VRLGFDWRVGSNPLLQPTAPAGRLLRGRVGRRRRRRRRKKD
jgi:hypothetical protein